MIRHFNIPTKLASTWQLAGLPEIPSDRLKLLNQAIELRNAFVHYKWPAFSHQDASDHKSHVELIAGQMADLVVYFQRLDNDTFWNGREDQIIAAFRAEISEREMEEPPPDPEKSS